MSCSLRVSSLHGPGISTLEKNNIGVLVQSLAVGKMKLRWNILYKLGNGCASVGRAVASDTRDLGFEYNFGKIYLPSTVPMY